MELARPAGFWIRVAATVIDAVIFIFVERSFVFAGRLVHGVSGADVWSAASLVSFFTLLFTGAYSVTLHATGGQTIGKLLVGVRVVALDGGVPTVGQAFLRWLGYGLSALPFGLGYLMAGLRRDRRALHDLLAGTRVEHVRVHARTPVPPAEQPVEVAPDLG
jgi:uncharacterized RDD family membrane protein YckC